MESLIIRIIRKQRELAEIQALALDVLDHGVEVSSLRLYQMFGSLSRAQVEGLVIGLNCAISALTKVE